MQVQLTRWGNSLGMRVPKELVSRFGLKAGARVEVQAEANRIVITLPRPEYRIEDLVADMTHENMRQAFDWGPDVGREIID